MEEPGFIVEMMIKTIVSNLPVPSNGGGGGGSGPDLPFFGKPAMRTHGMAGDVPHNSG